MKVSKKGIQFIKKRTDLSLTGYFDPIRNLYTIGYGYVGMVNGLPITEKLEITEKEADMLFHRQIEYCEDTIKQTVVPIINQNKFDALASFIFHNGRCTFVDSNILKEINMGSTVSAILKLRAYTKSELDGMENEEIPLLKKIRYDEAALFFTQPPSLHLYTRKRFIKDLTKCIGLINSDNLFEMLPILDSDFFLTSQEVSSPVESRIVFYLKKYLRSLGYFTGKVDQYFDIFLITAIKKFKIANKFEDIDGTCDIDVWVKLLTK